MNKTFKKEPKMIQLENRAWKGTRCYIHSDIADQYPFQIELGFHWGKGVFMLEIYHYDPTSECYEQRYSAAEIVADREMLIGKNPMQLLEQAEEILSDYYGFSLTFDKDPAVVFAVP